jgi:hypothetical protein
MNYSRALGILVLVFLLTSMASIAQVDISSVTLRAGSIRTQSADYSGQGYMWSFYPELEIGGHFFAPSLSWGASWGHWTDGITQTLPIADHVTYSQQGHIVSGRIGLRPQVLDSRWPIPLTIFVGVAQHFTSVTYVGGRDLVGNPGTSSSQHATTGFFGLAISIPVAAQFSLQAEVLQFVAFGDEPIDHAQKNRRAFTLGAAVTF